MKVTTGPVLLLITVGGLIVYLGQKYFAGETAFPASPVYAEATAPQPAPCTPDASLTQREAAVATAEAQQTAQSAELDRRLGEITQREANLDARQAGIEAREAELAQGQSELAQGRAALEQERTAVTAEKDRLAQEDQRQDARSVQLAQWEGALKAERAALDGEWDQLRLFQWVLYGLIAVTGATLLALTWLAYRLIRASRRPEVRLHEDHPAEMRHPDRAPTGTSKYSKPTRSAGQALQALS